jgi:hypothetical protein
MANIELTDAELRMVSSALRAYLQDFGHDEATELRAIKQLIAKFSQNSVTATQAESA